MFTDIAGFTARTSKQSRAENAEMLKQHDELLLPVVARFGGRRVKSIGDALLVVFRSPTDAVRCGMAMQDALTEYNRDRTIDDALHVRVALNLGEVRLDGGDIFGEPVNIAARIEALTPADTVYFSESVYLAMTKAEVRSEKVGTHELKGIPEPVTVYRAVPIEGAALPFGGLHRVSTPGAALDPVSQFFARAGKMRHAVAKRTHEVVRKSGALTSRWDALRKTPTRAWLLAIAVFVALVAVIVGARFFVASTPSEVETWLTSGRLAEADAYAQKRLAENPSDARGCLVAGHVAFARDDKKTGVKHYACALQGNGGYASDERLATNLVDALASIGKPAVELVTAHKSSAMTAKLVARTTREGYYGRRRAVEALQAIDEGNRIDEAAVALADLKEAPECSQRLNAVKRLRERKAVQALPALREAASDSFTNRMRNNCLIDEAGRAVRELRAD
jgi:hypothetical protein